METYASSISSSFSSCRWLRVALLDELHHHGAAVDRHTYHVTAHKPHDPSKVVVKLSLSTQNLYVMEGDRLLMAVQGNVGKPGAPTPTGNFTIIDKGQNQTPRQRARCGLSDGLLV